ncbi:MAG: hypothetical protein SFU85_11295 [Candidatus Methylacidiphilales bacterium]|nr:hypothetical protein [Candidatus Methylacidiphilales bacterium]
MLKANCRGQFTADDFQFVVRTLSRSRKDAVPLADLLADEDTRDCVVDHDLVYRELLDECHCLKVSPAFYFYVLVRQASRRAGIDDREMADYISAVLVEFGRKAVSARDGEVNSLFAYPYISDMLLMLKDAGPWERLMISSHIADYSLFVSGVFADRVRAQNRLRGGPDLRFYEEMGQSHYRAASNERLVEETEHKRVFRQLGERFHQVRRVLNELAENVLHLSGGHSLLPGRLA